MKFYELPPYLETLVNDRTARPFVRISVEIDDTDIFVNDSDIIECDITAYIEKSGGIINRGKLLLSNTKSLYTEDNGFKAGCLISVWYCFNDITNCYRRFILYADDKGFQEKQNGQEKYIEVNLTDLSEKLNDKNTQVDFTGDMIFTHKKVCDKTQPQNSLVHLIASRAGLTVNDIDCADLDFEITYVRISGSVWEELSELARAYNAMLECSKDKPLSFTESPYDTENEFSDESGFLLTQDEITKLHKFNNTEDYANSVRLKFTRYVMTDRQELWRYKDAGVWYDEEMTPYYPCTDDSREIFQSGYEAKYLARNENGKYRTVVWSEEVDDQEHFEENIETYGETPLEVLEYDTTTHKDKALLQLSRNEQNIAIKTLVIIGKAIIAETNTCVYRNNTEEVNRNGLLVKNVTNKYLSDDTIDEKPFYEKRTEDELIETSKHRKGYYITTNLAVIHARAGACIDIQPPLYQEAIKTRITEVSFCYKRDMPFETRMWTETV